jgi:hypothetical protein
MREEGGLVRRMLLVVMLLPFSGQEGQYPEWWFFLLIAIGLTVGVPNVLFDGENTNIWSTAHWASVIAASAVGPAFVCWIWTHRQPTSHYWGWKLHTAFGEPEARLRSEKEAIEFLHHVERPCGVAR